MTKVDRLELSSITYRYSPGVRVDIGTHVNKCNSSSEPLFKVEITVRSIKKAYFEGRKEKRAAQDDDDVTELSTKKTWKTSTSW